ncbi:MAG: hypothetical protein ABIO55_16100 [Ginsengibacter sp.]
MLYNVTISQTHGGVEQYYYPGNKRISAIVPRVYFQNKKNWYGEVRYNYDDLETISFNAGKTFSNDDIISYTVTPIAGIMAGKSTGALLGLNGELDYKKLFFTAESQYAFSAKSRTGNFFYNWSELGYQVTGNIYTGLALQVTRLYKTTSSIEPGFMTGASFNNWTFPMYIFNPMNNSRYFVLGINIEWNKINN